jgi:hypothetical protein
MKPIIAAVLLLASLAAPAFPGERLLGIAMIPRQIPYSPFAIERAMELAYENHCRVVQMGWTWSSLEPAPGQFALTDLTSALAIMSQRGFKVMLNIQVINTNVKETPSDLLGVPFSAPVMASRFQALLNQLAPHLDERVVSLSVGNEVDAYLASHPDEWSTYRTFFEAAVQHLHTIRPGLPVGVCCTYDGTVANRPAVIALNTKSDLWITTYYPFINGFTVRNPTAPLVDFPDMIAMANGRPVQLQEVGYPTSRANGSSPAQQAEFVRNMFTAWNSAGDAIPHLSYFGLHDFTARQVRGFLSYYGLSNRTFRTFLSTLGLREATGRAKPGWNAFQTGAATFIR